MKPSRLSLIVTLALLLGACALPKVGSDYQAPATNLPEQWTSTPTASTWSAAERDSLRHWWTQLGDSQLDELIEQALQATAICAWRRRGCSRRGRVGWSRNLPFFRR